jgi:4'-phosphopantetheinyl transferase
MTTAGEVIVVMVPLSDRHDGLVELLDSDERERATGFYFGRDRYNYIAAHGLLRLVLGRQLGVDPRALRFDRGRHGKPHLVPPTELRFNLSHTHGLVAVAFCRGRDVGVDVEAVREGSKIEAIGRQFFCPEEVEDILALSPADQRAAFFRCWTRKEALIKATGMGLSLPLDTFRVSTRRSGGTAGFDIVPRGQQWWRQQGPRCTQWSIMDVRAAKDGYVAALAANGPALTTSQERPSPVADAGAAATCWRFK